MSSYFDKFKADERTLRQAVGDIFANYRIADEMKESVQGRVETNGTVYQHGSKEPIPGNVRKPGTRMTHGGPKRYPRFAEQ